MLYGYLDWIALQCTPFTATDEYLEAWGALKRVTRKPCAQSSGAILFNGTDGKIIPSGAAIRRSDGMGFTTTLAAKVQGSTVTVTASADPDTQGLTGANGDCLPGTLFTLANAITGIDPTGYASAAFTGGADIERDDDYRERILYVYQNPPQGGDESDYVEWVLSAPGVTRAWCIGNGFGLGSVVVYFMMDAATPHMKAFHKARTDARPTKRAARLQRATSSLSRTRCIRFGPLLRSCMSSRLHRRLRDAHYVIE